MCTISFRPSRNRNYDVCDGRAFCQSPAGAAQGLHSAGRTFVYREIYMTEHNTPTAPQYAPQPPKKSHTVRNVLLGIVLLMVLVVGGCLALVGTAANEVGKAIEENDNRAGGANNPMAIEEGKAFDVAGFKYANGWKLSKDFGGYVKVSGLKVTNNRKDKDSALVEIKFWKGKEVLALVDCSTEPIAPDTTVTLDCLSTDKLPKAYSKITINDTF